MQSSLDSFWYQSFSWRHKGCELRVFWWFSNNRRRVWRSLRISLSLFDGKELTSRHPITDRWAWAISARIQPVSTLPSTVNKKSPCCFWKPVKMEPWCLFTSLVKVDGATCLLARDQLDNVCRWITKSVILERDGFSFVLHRRMAEGLKSFRDVLT